MKLKCAILERLLAGLLVALSFIGKSEACSVCFNNVSDDKEIIALKWSMFALLAVLLFVLTLFIKFFLKIRKNEKLMLDNTRRI